MSGRLLQSFLFGVGPLDPVAFVAAAGVLIGVAVLAAFVPARRATRIDPLLALRVQERSGRRFRLPRGVR